MRAKMHPATLLLCLALAGCASADAAGPPQASSTTPAPSGYSARAQAGSDEWWKEGGVTREKINAMCWMKYENGRNGLPVETRADLVAKCAADALKRHPL